MIKPFYLIIKIKNILIPQKQNKKHLLIRKIKNITFKWQHKLLYLFTLVMFLFLKSIKIKSP